MYDFVLFDLDQTLLYRRPTLPERVWELVSRRQPGLSQETVDRAWAEGEFWQGEQIRRENATGVRLSDEEYLEGLLAVYGRFFPLEQGLRGELTELFLGHFSGEYALAPGAEELLEALGRRHIPAGVVSNNRPAARGELDRLGIGSCFACVVLSEEVGLYKPDPRILELACRQLELSPGRGVYVGDHPFDVLCAHSAGMAALWLPPNPFFRLPAGERPPEHTAGSLRQAGELLLGSGPL